MSIIHPTTSVIVMEYVPGQSAIALFCVDPVLQIYEIGRLDDLALTNPQPSQADGEEFCTIIDGEEKCGKIRVTN